MSTKIYNGFKIETSSFRKINKLLDEYQKEVYGKAEEDLTKQAVQRAVSRFDNITAFNGQEANFFSVFFDVEQEIVKEQKSPYHSLYDFRVEIFLYPRHKDTLGIIYHGVGTKEARNVWFNKPWVLDYAYWDNTDPPRNMSYEDWKKRGREWDSAIGYNPPAQVGFTRTIVPDNLMPLIGSNHWKKYIPNKQARAKNVAMDLAFAEWQKENDIKVDANNAYKEYRNFTKYIKTKKGAKLLAKNKKIATRRLKAIKFKP